MKQITTAIIDSGISSTFSAIDDVIGGAGFILEDDSIYMTDDYEDNNGHGTQCASIIKKYCPDTKLYVVKILNDDARGYSIMLMLALKHLIGIDVDVINVSVSFHDVMYCEEIQEIINKLFKQGKIVNVSVANGKETSFPASFDGCFGVLCDHNCKNIVYNKDKSIQITARAFPEFCESINETYEWFGGNSKSAAAISGIAAQALGSMNDDEEAIEYFIKYLSDNHNYIFKESEYKIIDSEKIIQAYELCHEIFLKYIECSCINIDTSLIIENRVLVSNSYDMILECERKLCLNISKEKLLCVNFKSIRSFLLFLLEYGSD